MNRLLQGDVGSGKTIVCLFAMLLAVEGGYQTALMAPTELLAEQHAHHYANQFSTTMVYAMGQVRCKRDQRKRLPLPLHTKFCVGK